MRKPPAAEKEITREERIKSFAPIQPGYFAVFYDVKKKALAARVPVVGWAVYEREEFQWEGDEPSVRVLRDIVEAMVLTNQGEAELVSNFYELDDDGSESFRLLGIAIPGDTTDWNAEMERDAELVRWVSTIKHPDIDAEETPPKDKTPPSKRGSKGKKSVT